MPKRPTPKTVVHRPPDSVLSEEQLNYFKSRLLSDGVHTKLVSTEEVGDLPEGTHFFATIFFVEKQGSLFVSDIYSHGVSTPPLSRLKKDRSIDLNDIPF